MNVLPSGLCPVHHQQAFDWRNNEYDRRNPDEWPGGRSSTTRTSLMDSRTSHEERSREFEQKNREQIASIERICKSGRSPQCTPPCSSLPQEGGTDGNER